MSLATGKAAFEWIRKHSKERKVFGKPLSEFQVTHHKLVSKNDSNAFGFYYSYDYPSNVL